MAGAERGLTRLAEILVFDKPLDRTAQDVADLARSSLDYCDGVGVQLLDRDGLSARASTDRRSSHLDALQDALDNGPCVESLRTGELHDLEPVTGEERWPSFAPSAREAGLVACLALPLTARGELIGVLNLYAWPTGGFPGWDRPHCTAFARRASVSLASAQAYAHSQILISDLEERLAALPDDIVERAHGVLMALENESLDDAFARLAELADTQRCTVEVAAQAVLDSVADRS
jgi:GAF domain-containing protein